jgi:hypothetical protein
MSETTKQDEANVHPALRPVHLGLFPTMDSLDSVLDMALSQMPIMSPNQLVTVLMTYHNTLLKVQKEESKP